MVIFELFLDEAYVDGGGKPDLQNLLKGFKVHAIPYYEFSMDTFAWKIVTISVGNILDLARLVKTVTENNLGHFRLLSSSNYISGASYQFIVIDYGLK